MKNRKIKPRFGNPGLMEIVENASNVKETFYKLLEFLFKYKVKLILVFFLVNSKIVLAKISL